VEIKIHTGRRAFNAMSSISRKILKINYLHAHDFLNLGGLIGRPVDIDQRVMKTRVREVWKYRQTGKGRFALRITLENNIVVGWDDKT